MGLPNLKSLTKTANSVLFHPNIKSGGWYACLQQIISFEVLTVTEKKQVFNLFCHSHSINPLLWSYFYVFTTGVSFYTVVVAALSAFFNVVMMLIKNAHLQPKSCSHVSVHCCSPSELSLKSLSLESGCSFSAFGDWKRSEVELVSSEVTSPPSWASVPERNVWILHRSALLFWLELSPPSHILL